MGILSSPTHIAENLPCTFLPSCKNCYKATASFDIFSVFCQPTDSTIQIRVHNSCKLLLLCFSIILTFNHLGPVLTLLTYFRKQRAAAVQDTQQERHKPHRGGSRAGNKAVVRARACSFRFCTAVNIIEMKLG